jgi:hypothetical protein
MHNEPNFIIDDPHPDSILRAFRRASTRDRFVDHGILRFGRLDHYKSIECNVRRDSTEGTATFDMSYEAPCRGIDDRHDTILPCPTSTITAPASFELSNPKYVSCFSVSKDVNTVGKFGRYIVVVHQPFQLFHRIAASVAHCNRIHRLFVDCFPVRYDKGEPGTSDSGRWSVRLPYGQKPPSFADEMEYRVAIVASRLPGPLRPAPDSIVVSVGSLRHIATAIDL